MYKRQVCDGPFFKKKTVAVVGGGSSALQSARLLAGLCEKVYLIHRREQFRGEQLLAGQLADLANVEFVLNSTVQGLSLIHILSPAITARFRTGTTAKPKSIKTARFTISSALYSKRVRRTV